MFAWQKQNAAPKFALLLTCLEDGISADRSALRRAGLTHLHSIASGAKALEIIGDQAKAAPALAADFAICAGDLADMSLSAFMRALAALASPLPVMVISGRDEDLALAASLGAAVTLRRPYSGNELAGALMALRARKYAVAAPADGGAAPKPRPANAAPAREPENRDNKLLWTRAGLRLLRQGELGRARELLAGALDYDPLDLEAAMGLSRLCQQSGDLEKYHRWLHRAGQICLSTGQTERAELIFSRLPEKWQGDHALIEGVELLRECDFDTACRVFVDICAARKDLPLHRLLGRACQFTDAPADCMRELVDALARAGYESTARALSARMCRDEEEREPRPEGFRAAFPLLYEAWTVARFTAQALRDAV